MGGEERDSRKGDDEDEEKEDDGCVYHRYIRFTESPLGPTKTNSEK